MVFLTHYLYSLFGNDEKVTIDSYLLWVWKSRSIYCQDLCYDLWILWLCSIRSVKKIKCPEIWINLRKHVQNYQRSHHTHCHWPSLAKLAFIKWQLCLIKNYDFSGIMRVIKNQVINLCSLKAHWQRTLPISLYNLTLTTIIPNIYLKDFFSCNFISYTRISNC